MAEVIVKGATDSFMRHEDVYIAVVIKIGGHCFSRCTLDGRHIIRICRYKGLLTNIGERYIAFIIAVIPIHRNASLSRKEIQIAVVIKINGEKCASFV